MTEAEKFIEREKRVQGAKIYLDNLKAQIKDAEARYELTPRYEGNSNLPNIKGMNLHHEIGRLKKEYRENEHAIKIASVDDDLIDDVLRNIDI